VGEAISLLNEAAEHIRDLSAQVQFAVDYMNDHGLLEEGCFTFPDGVTVHATQTLEE
jgi:hypothetical protein